MDFEIADHYIYLVIFVVVLVVLNFILFVFHYFNNPSLKKRLGIKRTSILISWDLGDRPKKRNYYHKSVVGQPDAVAGTPLFLLYILPIYKEIEVVDVKSNHYRGKISDYQRYQLNLYYQIVKKSFIAFNVTPYLQFVNQKVKVQVSKQIIKNLYGLRLDVYRLRKKFGK